MKIWFISKMSLDKFGRASSHLSDSYSNATTRSMILPIAFTSDGDIDCEKRRLCNVKDPLSDVDAVNRKYFLEKVGDDIQQIRSDFQIAFNNYGKSMSISWDGFVKQNEFKLAELNGKCNGLEKVMFNIQNDLKTTQEHVLKLLEVEKRVNEKFAKLSVDTEKRITNAHEEVMLKIDENTTKIGLMQEKISKYFEEVPQFHVTTTTLGEQLTATDSLTKNVERELNQFRNTIVPQISELSLMIRNGDDDTKRKLMLEITQMKQDVDKLKKNKRAMSVRRT